MLNITELIISTLVNDATLTAIVPATSIFYGPVDIAEEKQAELFLPQINVRTIAESTRTVPLGARDATVQIDIWSRNSQLEVENIYERVLTLLNFLSGNKNTSHLFWERSSSATDMYESDRRIFRKSLDIVYWAM